ncbi:MAG: DUF4230 domain-containing protein [Chthoniobacterales bacterium]
MNPAAPTSKRRTSWALAFLLICVVGATLVAFLFWRIESWPMRSARQGSAELERLARSARDAFVDLAQLQPRVTINNRVYLEQTHGVAELATLARQTEIEHEFIHTWAGSTKRVKLHGSFLVKAGFDLRDNLSIDVRDNAIAVQIPHATVLSVEQQKVDVLAFENGYWNRITAADLEKELAALPRLARERAAQSDLLPEAEIALRQQLETRLGTERPVRLLFTPATAPGM